MSDWSSPSTNPLADLQEAMRKIRSQPYQPTTIGPIHPSTHARACRLLGLPTGTRLTERDLWKAVEVERQQMTPEERRLADQRLAEIMAQTHYGWPFH